VIIFITSFIVSIISIPKISFPTDEVIPDEISPHKKSRIVFPCTLEQYKLANKLANDMYDKKDNISFKVVNSWRRKNELILSLYYDSNNKLMGYFDVLPLTKEFEQKLREGIVTEEDINHDSLLSPYEMQSAEIIYIGGIAVRNIKENCRSYHGGLILSSLLVYLKTFYSFKKPVIMSATAANKCGAHLLEKLGFRIYKEGIFRSDNHDYYIKEVSSKDINNWGKTFGKTDCSAYKRFINSEYGLKIFGLREKDGTCHP
jgi:hypothetical protein